MCVRYSSGCFLEPPTSTSTTATHTHIDTHRSRSSSSSSSNRGMVRVVERKRHKEEDSVGVYACGMKCACRRPMLFSCIACAGRAKSPCRYICPLVHTADQSATSTNNLSVRHSLELIERLIDQMNASLLAWMDIKHTGLCVACVCVMNEHGDSMFSCRIVPATTLY